MLVVFMIALVLEAARDLCAKAMNLFRVFDLQGLRHLENLHVHVRFDCRAKLVTEILGVERFAFPSPVAPSALDERLEIRRVFLRGVEVLLELEFLDLLNPSLRHGDSRRGPQVSQRSKRVVCQSETFRIEV
jgi:hypothetical protein